MFSRLVHLFIRFYKYSPTLCGVPQFASIFTHCHIFNLPIAFGITTKKKSGFIQFLSKLQGSLSPLLLLSTHHRKIVARIDTDGDGRLSRDEIIAQLMKLDKEYLERDLSDQWSMYDANGDTFITFQEYKDSFGMQGR